eukprot:10598474-Ditylum_brightwellii.AAC.1
MESGGDNSDEERHFCAAPRDPICSISSSSGRAERKSCVGVGLCLESVVECSSKRRWYPVIKNYDGSNDEN